MKLNALFLLICFVFGQNLNAQTKVITKTRILDKSSTVLDSAGNKYPYVVWQNMLMSGNYKLKPVDPLNDSTAYLIEKQNETERNRMMSRIPKPAESPFFTDGQTIESFYAHAIDGSKIKLRDLAGKVVVLNFWFIGCPPCRMEIPELNKIAEKYAGDPNVVFIAIGLDGRYDIKQFIKNTPYIYHLIDDGKAYADLYKINLYPTNVVLDKNGKVVFHASGYGINTPYWITKSIEDSLK